MEGISLERKLYLNRDNDRICVGKEKRGERSWKGIKVRNVKGRVVDEDGEGMIGGSVLVKGSSNGVISDMDGNYNLIEVGENGLVGF